jgi:hypothetical protein
VVIVDEPRHRRIDADADAHRGRGIASHLHRDGVLVSVAER